MPTRPKMHRPHGAKPREVAERDRRAALDARRPSAEARGYDADWRRCRAAYLSVHPFCAAGGCSAPATDVDHILSIRQRPDLRLAWSNLRAMCHPCHSRRTATDQGFARR